MVSATDSLLSSSNSLIHSLKSQTLTRLFLTGKTLAISLTLLLGRSAWAMQLAVRKAKDNQKGPLHELKHDPALRHQKSPAPRAFAGAEWKIISFSLLMRERASGGGGWNSHNTISHPPTSSNPIMTSRARQFYIYACCWCDDAAETRQL